MAIERRRNQWYVRFQFRGREYREPTGLPDTRENESAAKEFEKNFRAELRVGKVSRRPRLVAKGDSAPSFQKCAEAFLDWCERVEYRNRLSTFNRIKTSFASAISFFSERRIADIASQDIGDYRDHRITINGVQDSTLHNDLCNLSLFFRKYAIPRHLAENNPVSGVTRPSKTNCNRFHILPEAEERAYFKSAVAWPNLHDVGRLMILQGCRPEEVLRIQQEDVKLSENSLHVSSKTRAGNRELPITSEAAGILKRRLKVAKEAKTKWLFPSPRYPGRHMTKLNNQHEKALIAANMDSRFVLYDLRHTWATRILSSGKCDVGTLKDLLGHSTLSAVMKYVHPQKQAKIDAVKRYDRSIKVALRRVK